MPSPHDQLERALNHHRAGRLDKAARAYEQVLRRHPRHPEALQLLGQVALQRGEPEEALRLLDRALASDPEHAPALLNRARALERLGRLAEAAQAVQGALALQPDRLEAHLSLGRLLAATGRLDQAVEALEQACRRWPDRVDPWQAQAVLLADAGRHLQAVEACRKGLALRPSEAALHAILGGALLALGRQAEGMRALGNAAAMGSSSAAVLKLAGESACLAGAHEQGLDWLRRAHDLAPDEPTLFLARMVHLRQAGRAEEAATLGDQAPLTAPLALELGNARLAAGDRPGAIAAWRKARQLDPSLALAAHHLGAALCREGLAEEGLPLLAEAARAHPEPWPWISYVDALAAAPEAAADPADLLAALSAEGVDHQQAERAVRQVLGALPGLEQALEAPPDAPLPAPVRDALVDHPLLVPWLTRTQVRHPDWEHLLIRLRHDLLDDLLSGRSVPLHALEALAIQAFHGEHAWWSTPEEQQRVEEALVGPVGELDPPRLAALAAWRPLQDLPGAEALAAPGWAQRPLAALVHQQFVAPAEEARLAEQIPVLALTDDQVSQAVRQQYEDHPYPRLVAIHRKPAEPLASVLKALLPHAPPWQSPQGPLQVLIAGCGTGQQALTAANRYQGAQVLGVDLSRRSLARAARLAQAWGLDNLELAQADILALGGLERRFHLVEAGGVLHHMADPLVGWRVLVGLLEPGGLMKVGLYAEAARQPVVAARALVAARGFAPTPEGLRQARRALMDLPEDHPARPVVWSPDFYSCSGLRDLVFHVCEHRFTLPGLGEALHSLGLELLGFQHPWPEPAARYAERWPDDKAQRDLGRWEILERERPELFAGMYQIWARRR